LRERWPVVDRAAEIGVVLLAHRPHVAAVPRVRIGEDRPLWLVRLGEEEPVPPRGGESGVGAVERLGDRHAVEHREARDGPRRVQGQASGDVAAAIVAHDREPLVPQMTHQADDVAGIARLEYGP